jgi:hypothetical protein
VQQQGDGLNKVWWEVDIRSGDNCSSRRIASGDFSIHEALQSNCSPAHFREQSMRSREGVDAALHRFCVTLRFLCAAQSDDALDKRKRIPCPVVNFTSKQPLLGDGIMLARDVSLY